LRSGKPSPFPSPKEALNYQYNDWERQLARAARAHFTAGTPEEVKARLLALADLCKVDEIMIMTMAHSHAARIRSYELLARSFQL
jgi:alkanesulfonate monooxygenase SsuD/methylene tetrahydromethanopterin reductase-like flavin-dependent oxidoreductase (luciferase family)